MSRLKLFSCLLIVLLLSASQLLGQCMNMGSFDNPGCQEELRTYSSVLLPCASGQCRYDFNGGTLNLVSRTATTATFRIPANPGSYSMVYVSAFDSVNNCTSLMDFTDRYAQFSPAVISGTIPGCPVPGQTYVYTAQCYPNSAFFGIQETNSWTVAGGTTVGTSFFLDAFGLRTDTIKVQWNASGSRYLRLNRSGNGNTASGTAFCTKYDTIFAGGSPPPVLSGPTALCGTNSADYSIPSLDPAFTYTWLCSNGLINSGQGTATANVTLSGNGSVSIVRTSISCGSSDTTSVSVVLSGSAAPSPTLPATVGLCSGQSLYLNPGTFSSYSWSNLYTSPSITATTAGTYTVTVTNTAGCQATASTTITNSGVPPSPTLSNVTACMGTNVTLNPGSFSSYVWSTGATTPTISVSTSGTYSVTVTNSFGCTGTSSSTVTFVAPTTPTITYTPVCDGSSTTLSAGTYSTYHWSNMSIASSIVVYVGGLYSVTVTDTAGCITMASTVVTFYALPSFSLGNDTIICADTTILLNGPSGMSNYSWSSGSSSQGLLVSNGGNYSLTVTNSNGCSGTDTISISGLTDCVFPGDANYDGVADNADILTLGVNAGMTGTARAGANIQWYGQSTVDWGGGLPGNADPKHSDCDGNGIVDSQDTMAVSLNYLKTHNKNNGTTTGPELRIISLQDSVQPGDTAWFAIHLGDSNFPMDSVHGLAMSLQHSQQGVSGTGWTNINYQNCWFSNANTPMTLTKFIPQNQTLDIAITRTDRADQAGYGEAGRFGILTDSLSPMQVLEVLPSSAMVVSSSLDLQPVTLVGGQTIISTVTASNSSPTDEPQIFPNPASDIVKISVNGTASFRIQLTDLQGRILLQQTATGSDIEISLGDFPAGSYVIAILTESAGYRQKLVIVQ